MRLLRYVVVYGATVAAQQELAQLFKSKGATKVLSFPTLWRHLDTHIDPRHRVVKTTLLIDGRQHAIYARADLWQVILDRWLLNPEYAKHLIWEPRLRVNALGHRIYGEPYECDRFVRVYNRHAQRGAIALQLLVFSDGVKDDKGSSRPLYIVPANLPVALRLPRRAKIFVGFMHKGSTASAHGDDTLLRRLLHAGLRVAFDTVINVFKRGGDSIQLGGDTRQIYKVVPTLFAYIADHVELQDVTLCTKHHLSAMPCHICVIPQIDFGNHLLAIERRYPRRSYPETRQTVQQAITILAAGGYGSITRAHTILHDRSLIGVVNVLAEDWDLEPHEATPPDKLHDADKGVYETFQDDTVKDAGPDKIEANRRAHAYTSGAYGHPDLVYIGELDLFPGDDSHTDGKKLRTLMRIFPLCIVGLPRLRELDIYEDIIELSISWMEFYQMMSAKEFTTPDIAALEVKGATWGMHYQRTMGVRHHNGPRAAKGATVKQHDVFVEFPRSITESGNAAVGDTGHFEETHRVRVP